MGFGVRTEPRRRPSPRAVVVLAALLLAGCSRMALQRPQPAPAVPASAGAAAVDVRAVRRGLTLAEAADYVGDGACGECHRSVHQEHSATRHTRTLQPVTLAEHGAAFRNGKPVRDPLRGLTYRAGTRGERGVISATDGRNRGELVADYVMGSGRNAMTFFSERDPNHYLKLRVSYYPRAGQWDFTPTLLPTDPLESPAGVIEQGPALEGCLLCHVTVLRKDAGQLKLPESRLGVGCERCHGPGKPHLERIRAWGRDPEIERLAAATPARINKICGDCHRTSENASLADPRVQRNLPRFQGLALEQSACYQKSGTLSCVSCHDPHRDSDPDLAKSDATCRSCHDGSEHKTACPVNRLSGCTNCHMPAQRISSIPHVAYRNHWIKVWGKAEPRASQASR